MSISSEYDIDKQIIVILGLCSREEADKLSYKEIDELTLKINKTLQTVEELGICSAGEAIDTYTYKELKKLIKEHKNKN